MSDHNTLLSNPSKKQFLSFVMIWFVGVFLLLLVITDGFNDFIIKKDNVLYFLLLLFSTWKMIMVFRAYFKHSKVITL